MGNAESLPASSAPAAASATTGAGALAAAALAELAGTGGDDAEPSVLLVNLPECFLYRVPPRPSAAGHVAQSWGLDTPLLTGALRITGRDKAVWLSFWVRRPAAAPTLPPPPMTAPVLSDAATAPAAQGHELVFACRVPALDAPFSKFV